VAVEQLVILKVVINLRRNLERCVLFQLRSGGCGIHVTWWELGQEWFSGSLEKVCRMLAFTREVVLHVVVWRLEGYCVLLQWAGIKR
jgi:hypothetical protein